MPSLVFPDQEYLSSNNLRVTIKAYLIYVVPNPLLDRGPQVHRLVVFTIHLARYCLHHDRKFRPYT